LGLRFAESRPEKEIQRANTVEREPTKPAEPPTPLLIPDAVAAALAGVSRAHWHRLRAAGKLPPPVRLGRRVLWRRLEIEAWIAASCPDSRTWAAMSIASRRLSVR
jgi:predicted DNA-binding transcriptional regulator AlpA